ncbi:MAG: glycosyltransferase, partial [Candidatus Kariarchaeaceae archaeon]
MSDLERKRVLFLITELNPGGAQAVLYRLISKLNPDKFNPQVVCFYNGNSNIAKNIRRLGIPVTDIGFSNIWRVFRLWRLWRKIINDRPIFLHCWLFHANIVGRLFGYCLKVPVIITSRRNVEIGDPIREYFKRITRNFDHVTITVCNLARSVEIKRAKGDPGKVVTIYNGLDVTEFDNLASELPSRLRNELNFPQNSIIIGSVGRLHPQKGFLQIIDAIQYLRSPISEIYLIIIGDGELRHCLEKHVKSVGLENRVRFTGWRNDIPNFLTMINIFVLPSLWEGMPNAVLEAMAAGLPVVATNVGGTPEVVVDGETGFLVPP